MPETQGLLNAVYDPTNRALRMLAPGGAYWPYPQMLTIDPGMVQISHSNFNTHTLRDIMGWHRLSSGAQNAEVVFGPLALGPHPWSVTLSHLKGPDRGIYRIATAPILETVLAVGDFTDLVDQDTGVPVVIDGYAASESPVRTTVWNLNVGVGWYALRVKMATKNASSSSYVGALGKIHLARQWWTLQR